jgi:hypothetical protein
MDAGKALCLFEHTKKNALGDSLAPLRVAGKALNFVSEIGVAGREMSDDDEGEDGNAMDTSPPGASGSVPPPAPPPVPAPAEAPGSSQIRRPPARPFQPPPPADEDSDDEEEEDTVLQRTMRKVFESKDEDLDDQFYQNPITGQKSKYTKRMYKLVELLKTPLGLKMLKNAVRVNMRFKVERYMKMRGKIEAKHAIEKRKYERMEDGIRRDAKLKDDEDNWHIFEKIGDQLVDLEKQIGSLLVVEDRARELLNEDNLDTDGIDAGNTSIPARRDELLKALDRLSFYNQQPMILEAVSEIVYGFLINPSFVRRKFMNFLFAGPAGTGKTSIVREISAVFSVAGIFVFNTVVEGGRNDFIAPYEGQTVGKTMTFLTSGLDSGVIFVDEAYSITTWDKGVPSSYGAEATAAMVDFMTKYKGLYCLMFAGYEMEMRRYFLEANEGLPRRIPYQYRLKDYNPSQLVQIYKRTLLTEMGVPDSQVNEQAIRYIESAFTRETWVWLAQFVTYVRENQKWYYKKPQFDSKTQRYYAREIKTVPKRKYMWEIFKNQAGAMTNLAEATVVALINTVDPDQLTLTDAADSMQVEGSGGGSGQPGPSSDASDPSPDGDKKARTTKDLEATRAARFLFKRGNPLSIMRALIKDRIMNTFMSEAPLFLAEFQKVDDLANRATDVYFEEQVKQTQITGAPYVGRDYVDTSATIDVSSEEVDDSAYQVVKRLTSKPKKTSKDTPDEDDFDAMSRNATQKDLLQIRYCAGSYFHFIYRGEFANPERDKRKGWWNADRKLLTTDIVAAITRAYLVSHYTGDPLTTEQRKYLIGPEPDRMPEKGFTLSDPAEYKAHILETYLIYVDEYLDVELTLSYKRDQFGNVRPPKYQLRLINKAGFKPDRPNEPSVVFSVGVPFQAFRPETNESVLTRVLDIGERYLSNWDMQLKLFGQMASAALETMQEEYKIVVLGDDSSNGMKLPVPRLMLAPARGLMRKEAFEEGAVPYAWITANQTVASAVNSPKGTLTPPLKPKTTRGGAVDAEGDDDMPAATPVPAEGGSGRHTRAGRGGRK